MILMSEEKKYEALPTRTDLRVAGTFYSYESVIRYWDGKKLRCQHKKCKTKCGNCSNHSYQCPKCDYNSKRFDQLVAHGKNQICTLTEGELAIVKGNAGLKRRRHLVSYQEKAESTKKFKYCLTEIPKSTKEVVPGWQCINCGHISTRCFSSFKENATCSNCERSTCKKSLNDYLSLNNIQLKYVLDYIPETTTVNILGWKCQNTDCGMLREMCYQSVSQGHGCGKCSGTDLKTLKDYKDIAITNTNFEYILDNIPENSKTNVLGWKCLACGDIRNMCFASIRNGNGCGKCNMKDAKTLSDYQTISNKFDYILDYIPSKIAVPVLGWKCKTCHKIRNMRYDYIYQGGGCGACYGHEKKTLDDYKIMASANNFEYLGDKAADSTNQAVKFWKCLKCNDVRCISYGQIRVGGWACGSCSGTDKKTLSDYKSLYSSTFDYILHSIPANVSTYIIGWKCKVCTEIKRCSYKSVRLGSGCTSCLGKEPKTLEDYVNIATVNGQFEYILDEIPINTGTKVPGWKCINCDQIRDITYCSVREGIGCGRCSNKDRKTLNDYKDIAIKGGFVYENISIPETVLHECNGWTCIKCKRDNLRRYNFVYQGLGCVYCSKFRSENACRDIFEKLLNEEFIKVRPKFLQGLELDGYSHKLKLAFEYNGIQHYELHSFFHRNGLPDLESQKARDQMKIELCIANDINLIIIPYTYSYKDQKLLEEFIKDEIQTYLDLNVNIEKT